MILKDDFGFINSSGLEWLAKRGDKTDGASIPMAAWSIRLLFGRLFAYSRDAGAATTALN